MGEKPADLPISIRLSFEDSAALAVIVEVPPEASAGFPPYCDNSSATLPASDMERVDGQMDLKNEAGTGETTNDQTYPASFRPTKAEKEWIDLARGELSISDFIRSLIQAEMGKHTDLPKRRRRQPVKDHVELARAFALFGQARLISNLAQAVGHLNKGTWTPASDLDLEIRSELASSRELRNHLLAALGKEPSP